jgi:tetratricopeptide (TPR) repeat protein
MIGSEGASLDGFPSRMPDKAELRRMLRARVFADLTRVFEYLQAKFQADPKLELWPSEAADAFDSAEPELAPLLDAWVEATPNSFAPYLARGTYLSSVGYDLRGGRFASETPESAFAAMRKAMHKSGVDLKRAIEICPKLVAGFREMIALAQAMGSDELAQASVAEALKVCPTCFQVRVMYMDSIEPKWGGSYEAMDRFAQASQAFDNPQLRFLKGFVWMDQADELRRAMRINEALAMIQRALDLGEYSTFLIARARIYRDRGRMKEALADLDKANSHRPASPNILGLRAIVLMQLHRYEEAEKDVRAVLEIAPTESLLRNGNVLIGVHEHEAKARKAGHTEEADRVHQLDEVLERGAPPMRWLERSPPPEPPKIQSIDT